MVRQRYSLRPLRFKQTQSHVLRGHEAMQVCKWSAISRVFRVTNKNTYMQEKGREMSEKLLQKSILFPQIRRISLTYS